MTDPTPSGDSTPSSPSADPLYSAPDPAAAGWAAPDPAAASWAAPDAAAPSSGTPSSSTPGSGTPSSGTSGQSASPYATPAAVDPYSGTPSAPAPQPSPYGDVQPPWDPAAAQPSSGPGSPYPSSGPAAQYPSQYAEAQPPQYYGVPDQQGQATYGVYDPNAFSPSNPYGFSGAGQPSKYPLDYGYGVPYAQGYSRGTQTDGMAIASLIVSCTSVLGVCFWGLGMVLGIVGAILGHVSRSRIQKTGAGGAGMALAGIIVGWTITGLGAIFLAFLIVVAVTDGFS